MVYCPLYPGAGGERMSSYTRREFVKTAALGAAGLALACISHQVTR